MAWKSSCSQKVIFLKIKFKYPAFPHFVIDLEKYVFKKLLVNLTKSRVFVFAND